MTVWTDSPTDEGRALLENTLWYQRSGPRAYRSQRPCPTDPSIIGWAPGRDRPRVGMSNRERDDDESHRPIGPHSPGPPSNPTNPLRVHDGATTPRTAPAGHTCGPRSARHRDGKRGGGAATGGRVTLRRQNGDVGRSGPSWGSPPSSCSSRSEPAISTTWPTTCDGSLCTAFTQPFIPERRPARRTS